MFDPTPEQQAFLDELQANLLTIEGMDVTLSEDYQLGTRDAIEMAKRLFKFHFCQN